MTDAGRNVASAAIAYCPEHGLHGERQERFVCGGPVEHGSSSTARLMVGGAMSD